MGNDLKLEIDINNKNVLILSKGNKYTYIVIPPGKNRIDIITDKELINGYNYGIQDNIIIMIDEIGRKIFYNNKLVIDQIL